MHLLCINLLVLVLLPSSLSCDNKAELTAIRDDFLGIVETHMDNIKDELQNLSCQERNYKLANCNTDDAYVLTVDLLSIASNDIVETLSHQACELQRLKRPNMTKLAEIVQTSIKCTCPENATKDPSLRSRRRTPRNQRKKMNKRCKAKAILSSMTVCYQRLNIKYMDARN